MSGLFGLGAYELAGGVLAAGCAAGWARGRMSVSAQPGGGRGLAGRDAVRSRLSLAAVRRAAEFTRPELSPEQRATAAAAEVGVTVGSAFGMPLVASCENSLGVVGPPRMGKTLMLAIRWVLDAPGPGVFASTKTDVYRATTGWRARRGPVAVFDPDRLLGDAATRLRWNPVAGCAAPRVALRRAKALMATAESEASSVTNGNFFAGSAAEALSCLLHAAALGGHTLADVIRWAEDDSDATPYNLLAAPAAAPGWLGKLRTQLQGEWKTRQNVVRTIARGLAALSDPAVLTDCCPPAGEGFDPETFLTAAGGAGSVYVLAADDGDASAAPLATALVDELITVARHLAARRPSGRLDPPLTVVLDEVANGCPLPKLPNYVADSGGRGICLAWLAQSPGQLEHRWGDPGSRALRTATTTLIYLGGIDDARHLKDLSELAGERDDAYATRSRDERTNRTTTSTQLRRVPVLPVEVIRGLPPGVGLLYYQNLPPVRVALSPWTNRPDAAAIGEAAGPLLPAVPAPRRARRRAGLLRRAGRGRG